MKKRGDFYATCVVLNFHQTRGRNFIKIKKFARSMMGKTLLNALNEENHLARSKGATNIRRSANGNLFW